MSEKKIIELKNIAVSFDGEPVLKNLNLSISDGEFVTLLGPSGCGKTTTLRIIGGFVTPDDGDVFFDGKRVNDLPAYKRTVNTIFQRYALFPHLNVYENVAFGMRVQKKSNDEIKLAGFNVFPSYKGKEIEAQISWMQGWVLYITKRSTNVIHEARNYIWDTDADGNRLNKPIKDFDHAMDAMRYAAFGQLADFRTPARTTSKMQKLKR
jgi:ABC-type sugar transport system ATPase subunit